MPPIHCLDVGPSIFCHQRFLTPWVCVSSEPLGRQNQHYTNNMNGLQISYLKYTSQQANTQTQLLKQRQSFPCFGTKETDRREQVLNKAQISFAPQNLLNHTPLSTSQTSCETHAVDLPRRMRCNARSILSFLEPRWVSGGAQKHGAHFPANEAIASSQKPQSPLPMEDLGIIESVNPGLRERSIPQRECRLGKPAIVFTWWLGLLVPVPDGTHWIENGDGDDVHGNLLGELGKQIDVSTDQRRARKIERGWLYRCTPTDRHGSICICPLGVGRGL